LAALRLPPGADSFSFALSFSSVRLESATLQKAEPKFLMIGRGTAGGTALQAKQDFSRHLLASEFMLNEVWTIVANIDNMSCLQGF
jgi:hypothetical protein